jgi:peptide/nickel transport system substrate-binding protein
LALPIACFANANNIIIAISATPNNINPFFSTDANSQNINRLLHRSLIDYNLSMQPECRACETYSSHMHGTRQIISFKLRSDLVFTDGAKVTANDVKQSWQYFAKNKNIKSTFMDTFEDIESVDIKDVENFDITFKKFSLENLSNLALMKIIKIPKINNGKFEINDIVGCGDYTIAKMQTLEIILRPQDIKRSNLIFKVVKDETTLALKLINQEVDLSVANMSPRKISWLKQQKKDISTWELPSANYLFMGLNHKKTIFKDIRVRRALSLLIPRQEILKYKLKATAVLSKGMFSPAFADMYEDGQEAAIDSYNPNLAMELLTAAGYGTNGKKLEIDWKISNNKASIEVAEVIQNYFEKAGIVVNLSIQEWGTYMNSFKGGQFDVVVGQWVGFTGPYMLSFVYHSANIPPRGGNRTSYKNSIVDNLLDRATIETDSDKRIKLYKQAQRLITNDYAAINLWHPNIIWIGSPCLRHLELNPTGSFDTLPKVEKNCEKQKI